MKKILVIGLAAAMMTSTAFASTVENQQIQPGASIVFKMSDFKDAKTLYVSGTESKDAGSGGAVTGQANTAKLINPKTFKVSTTAGGVAVTANTYGDSNNYLGAPWAGKYGQTGDGSSTTIGDTFGIDTRGKGGGSAGNVWTEDDLNKAKLEVDKVARQNIQNYDFTATNFTVTYNAPVGKNFIKNYEFDGAGNLTVNLKADYKLPSNGKPDLVLNNVVVKAKRDIKNISNSNEVVLYKNRTFTATSATGGGTVVELGDKGLFSVGVETQEEFLSAGTEVDLGNYQNGEWVKFTADGAYTGDVKFDGGNIQVKGKVYNGDVVNFTYNAAPTDAAIKVIQNNPAEANIMVHNIVAKNFKTGFTVSIPGSSLFGAEADANGNVEVLSLVAANNKKLYLLSNTGVLTAAPFVYNNNTAAWEGRLPAQGGTILISDVALKGVTAGTTTGTGNPSTGFGVDFSSAVVK